MCRIRAGSPKLVVASFAGAANILKVESRTSVCRRHVSGGRSSNVRWLSRSRSWGSLHCDRDNRSGCFTCLYICRVIYKLLGFHTEMVISKNKEMQINVNTDWLHFKSPPLLFPVSDRHGRNLVSCIVVSVDRIAMCSVLFVQHVVLGGVPVMKCTNMSLWEETTVNRSSSSSSSSSSSVCFSQMATAGWRASHRHSCFRRCTSSHTWTRELRSTFRTYGFVQFFFPCIKN